MHSDAYWIDTGTPDTYLQAHLDLLERAPGASEPASTAPPGSTRRRVVRSVVGRARWWARTPAIRESIVMDGVHVGAGAVLERPSWARVR